MDAIKASDGVEGPEILSTAQADDKPIHVDDHSEAKDPYQDALPQEHLVAETVEHSLQELAEHGNHENLHEISTSASDDVTQTESSTKVPLQREWTERKSVISTSLADTHCAELGVTELLEKLNNVLGTAYRNYGADPSLESTPGLSALLENYISEGYDFGMAYGMLRPWWHSPTEFPSLLSTFVALESADTEAREQAVHNKLIVEPMMPPRRVWDLYSNRILPMWAIETDPDIKPNNFQRIMPLFALSHAWAFPSERQSVLTPINGKKWPVPIPKGTSLYNVRIELLNMGAEYVWLDVLCLRQSGGAPPEEMLRAKEWELDVPTIGAVYNKCQEVIVYLSGLGRPFQVNELDSKRHWCNRAWTVQEWCLPASMRLAGIAADSPKFRLIPGRGPVAEGPDDGYPQRLLQRMKSTNSTTRYIFQAAAEMYRRSAENELDKIAGLAYNFSSYESPAIPAYYETQSVEEAWLRFIQTMVPRARGDLLFLFPTTGDGIFKWTPSWRQILHGADKLASNDNTISAELSDSKSNPRLDREGKYTCSAVVLPRCILRGFHNPPSSETQWGTVTSQFDPILSFKATTHHRHPIQDGTYALLGSLGHYNSTCRFWVVGTLDDEGKHFTKISVVQMEAEEVEPKAWLFKKLELSEGGDGEDVSNMQSSYIHNVILA